MGVPLCTATQPAGQYTNADAWCAPTFCDAGVLHDCKQPMLRSRLAAVIYTFFPFFLISSLLCIRRWTGTSVTILAYEGAEAAAPNALLHYAFSPLFMKHLQPLGTPGSQATWDGKYLWPGVNDVLRKLQKHGERDTWGVNFPAVQELFLMHHQRWQAARQSGGGLVPAITHEQVLKVLDVVVVPIDTSGGLVPVRLSSDADAEYLNDALAESAQAQAGVVSMQMQEGADSAQMQDSAGALVQDSAESAQVQEGFVAMQMPEGADAAQLQG